MIIMKVTVSRPMIAPLSSIDLIFFFWFPYFTSYLMLFLTLSILGSLKDSIQFS